MIDAGRQELIARLQQELPNLLPALQQAAKFVLDHPQEIGLMAIRDAAARARVSSPSRAAGQRSAARW